MSAPCGVCGTRRFMKARPIPATGPWLLITCPACNPSDATLRVLASTEGWTT